MTTPSRTQLQLLPIVEDFEERSAIAEYDGGLARHDAEQLAMRCLFVIARISQAGRRYQEGCYHAIPIDGVYNNSEALNAWHTLPFDHPIATEEAEGGWDHKALCGAALPPKRESCWIDGTTVNCPKCLTALRGGLGVTGR
jgi:hypothetical protein